MSDDRVSVAVHESSHAAMAVLALGWPLAGVSIVPDQDSNGRTVVVVPGHRLPPPADQALLDVAGTSGVAIAMGVAEGFMAGLRRRDWSRRMAVAGALSELRRARTAFTSDGAFATLVADAVALLRYRPTWRAVLALAEALVAAEEVDGWRAVEILVTAAERPAEHRARWLALYRARPRPAYSSVT